MPIVGYDNEPLQGVALHGLDPAGEWTRVEVSPSDYLRIDLFSVRGTQCGYPDWHLNRYFDHVSDTNLSAGTNTISLTAIPAGDKMVLQQLAYNVNSATVTRVTVDLHDGTTPFEILDTTTVTAGFWESFPVVADLHAGDSVRVTVYGATAGDDLHLKGWGRWIKQ